MQGRVIRLSSLLLVPLRIPSVHEDEGIASRRCRSETRVNWEASDGGRATAGMVCESVHPSSSTEKREEQQQVRRRPVQQERGRGIR